VTDSEALNKVIENSGLKLTFIARALKLSREGFYKKLNNQTEFKASEIVKMQEILNLSNEQRDKIFFAN
jgi:DNA-binding phage protein